MQVIESADYFEVSSSDEEYVTETETETEKVHYSTSEIMEVLKDIQSMVKSLMGRQHSISTIIKEEDDPKFVVS